MMLVSPAPEAMLRDCYELAGRLADRTHLLILAPAAEERTLRRLGVRVDVWTPAGLLSVLRSIGSLRRSVERFQPDVIQIFGYSAGVVALGALDPQWTDRAILSLYAPLRPRELPKKFVAQRLPGLLKRPARIVCAYPSLAEDLIMEHGGESGSIHVIPPSIATPFPDAAVRPAGRLGPVFGFAGPVDADHAWEYGVDALALVHRDLPEARFRILGEGPLRAFVHAHAKTKSQKVAETVEFAPRQATAEFFNSIDMLLVPESRDPLPHVMLEALVAGVPVVAANSGARADTLGPFETGWLVPPDAEGFASGIRAVWADAAGAWAGALRQRAAAYERYGWATVDAAWDALYAAILSGRPAAEAAGIGGGVANRWES